jgi:hypothetical protein
LVDRAALKNIQSFLFLLTNPMSRNPPSYPYATIVKLMVVALSLTACRYTPSEAQLQAWHQEAIARNAEQLKERAHQTEQNAWQLWVQGQTKSPSTPLTWAQLQELATTHVPTPDPNYPADPKAIFDFRGIAVAQLLDRFGIAPNTTPAPTEVTFVAFDAFRATLSIADLRRYPIALALERDGKPIPRNQGGPLYLVIPYAQYPELKQKYDAGFWPFYVTHAIVGTEPVRLKIGNRQLDSAAFDKLPQTIIETAVGYKIGWPSGTVTLKGVRLRDALAAADLKLPPNGAVILRGKPPIYRDRNNPIRLSAAAVQNCDLLLATRWGDESQPIPARMGGPVTLAFPSSCPALTGKQRWVTFVEELEVES